MFEDKRKRAVCVWHRRAGKDSVSINITAVMAHQKKATYWHMLPTAVQGRHVIWDAINPNTGTRVIDQAWPKEIRAAINHTEMKITTKYGSTWQVVGSDNFDRLVGSNPFGIVFSEYSVSDPRAWEYIRPILAENGGWAIFIYTFRGKNHGYDLSEMAKDNDEWFHEVLTIDDTSREDGTPVVTQEAYQAEVEAGMDPLIAKQEFYCCPDAGLYGAYYTEALKKAKVGDYPWNPRKPVHTFWDLGLRDGTSIWFAQDSEDGSSIHIIDFWEEKNVSLIEWCGRINKEQYSYGVHSAPHDIKVRSFSDAQSYITTASEQGVDFEICPNLSRNEGIEATRSFIPRLRFNGVTTTKGHDALSNYRREYNDKLKVFMDRPLHDWSSHASDAMRMMAISYPENYDRMSGGNFGVKSSNGDGRIITADYSRGIGKWTRSR